jgi:hypothetical protein
MRKIYELDSHFATGERTVQPLLLWTPSGRPSYEGLTKTASEASEYIHSVEPKPGVSIVLVLALGAYETYDLNRNADGFNEHPYRVGLKPTCGCCTATDGWISQEEVLPQHYKTFEQYGKVYRHHQNKDPLKGIGDVFKAFWNPFMHRVELLVGLENSKAPDLAERIAANEYPAVSMGCRIKYDVCTICGHKAPTRAQYCEHLKFGLRQVTPSGLRAGALNPSPRFFDISFVIKPADQTGYMLKKVAEHYEVRGSAEMGEYLDRLEEKRAAIQKISDIDKVIRGLPIDHKTSPLSPEEASAIKSLQKQVMPAVQRMPLIDGQTLKKMSPFPISQTLSTLGQSGVMLTSHELLQLLLNKISPSTNIDSSMVDVMVALQGTVLDFLAKHPQLLDQIIESGGLQLNTQQVNPEITGIAEKYLEKRATIGDYLQRKLIPSRFRGDEPPNTDVLHVADPGTNERNVTTRGAAIAAHDEVAKRQLAKVVGGAALLGGAYKVLASGLPKAMHPLLAGTAVLGGSQFLRPDYGNHYMTDEGLAIPASTEMRKVSNLGRVRLPILGSAALVTGLSHDYESRLRNGYFDPNAPLHDQLMDHIGQQAHDHPALSMLGSLSLYGLARNALSKLSSFDHSDDNVFLSELNFDGVAEKIGSLILG